jgi:hypothetical protein
MPGKDEDADAERKHRRFNFKKTGWRDFEESTGVSEKALERRFHDNFVEGRSNLSMGTIGYSLDVSSALEFRPQLPASKSRPTHARTNLNPFYAFSATARAADPTDPNYFSDAESERTASVAEEYKQAERAERAAAAVKETPSTEQAEHNQVLSSNFDNLAQQAEQFTESRMAGRGRGGRPVGSGMLKGATWEHDASIKLESKPTDLFPVSTSSSN